MVTCCKNGTVNVKPEYLDWISTNVTGPCAGFCHYYSYRMRDAFPELRLVAGRYVHPQAVATHWWLETPDGEVVDPTASQFPSGGTYYEHIPSDDDPTGKCPNCGEYCYHGEQTCCKQCYTEYVQYLNNIGKSHAE